MGRFDPKQVIITFAGLHITGYMDGTWVSIKRASEDAKFMVGAYGDSTSVELHDKSATMELTLKHDVASNAALVAFRTLALATGEHIGPFTFVDKLSGESLIAPESRIVKPPDIEHGVDPGGRLWIFGTGSLTDVLGGGAL